MTNRPDLNKKLDSKTFRNYYYLKELYTKPEVRIVEFEAVDVIQTSGGAVPTKKINGAEAQPLGDIKYTDIFA